MDEDGGDDGGGWGRKLVALRLEGFLEIEGVGRDSGPGGFDLAPEVARFVDEEAVGVCEVGEDVLFEAEDLVLLRVVFGGEGVQGLEVFGRGIRY